MAQIAQLRGQISEIDIETLRMEAGIREEAISELRELGFRELELKERRLSLRERLSRLDIRSPRPGVILDMTVHAIKSVVRPAEPILYVVPSDSELIVEAQVDRAVEFDDRWEERVQAAVDDASQTLPEPGASAIDWSHAVSRTGSSASCSAWTWTDFTTSHPPRSDR